MEAKTTIKTTEQLEAALASVAISTAMNVRGLDFFLHDLAGDIAREREVLARFSREFSEQAFNALRWSEPAFDAAAREWEALGLFRNLWNARARNEEDPMGLVAEDLKEEVIREASSPSSSTSPAANLAHRAQLAARALLLGKLLAAVDRNRR